MLSGTFGGVAVWARADEGSAIVNANPSAARHAVSRVPRARCSVVSKFFISGLLTNVSSSVRDCHVSTFFGFVPTQVDSSACVPEPHDASVYVGPNVQISFVKVGGMGEVYRATDTNLKR